MVVVTRVTTKCLEEGHQLERVEVCEHLVNRGADGGSQKQYASQQHHECARGVVIPLKLECKRCICAVSCLMGDFQHENVEEETKDGKNWTSYIGWTLARRARSTTGDGF